MGIVSRQSTSNSIIQYLGFFIGFINIAILFPRFLDTDQFGLTRILLSIGALYSQFASLGIYQINIKFFPFFKTNDKKHHGFLFLGFAIIITGFIFITSLYVFFKDAILSYTREDTKLFVDNYYTAIPLSFFMLFFAYFESYLMGLYRSVLSNSLKNIHIRLIWMAELFLYHFGYIDFNTFLLLYIGAYGVIMMVQVISLGLTRDIHFHIERHYLKPRLLKLIASYGFYTIIANASVIMVDNISNVMLGFMLGLEETAIYGLAVYISSLVLAPAQAISLVSFPLIANEWKKKRLDNIRQIYYKSSITQLLIGGFVLICIWGNIDNIFKIIPNEYHLGKYVVLYMGLGRLYEMAAGVNSQIIVASKYYRFNTTSGIILFITIIVSNYLLIPPFGVEGAAIATAISIIITNVIRQIYLYYRLKMQPFSLKSIYACGIIFVAIIPAYIIPDTHRLIIDIIIKTSAITIVFIFITYYSNVSGDINDYIKRFIARIRFKH